MLTTTFTFSFQLVFVLSMELFRNRISIVRVLFRINDLWRFLFWKYNLSHKTNMKAIFSEHLWISEKTIVIRNGKIVWKHGPYCCYFPLNLKYPGWPYRAYIKTAKNGNCCEELLSENDIEAVLATFCCYDHSAKASEAVQKIATDQKEYRKCSSCVIICWIAKIYLSINNSEKWLVTRIPPT